MESCTEPPEEIWLDLDATDDPLHGRQEGRLFHGYYGRYCYLPLYVFCEGHLLCARLRRSNVDASAGSEEELARVVAQVRRRWPRTRVGVRGDSGFCPPSAPGGPAPGASTKNSTAPGERWRRVTVKCCVWLS